MFASCVRGLSMTFLMGISVVAIGNFSCTRSGARAGVSVCLCVCQGNGSLFLFLFVCCCFSLCAEILTCVRQLGADAFLLGKSVTYEAVFINRFICTRKKKIKQQKRSQG